MIADPAGVVDCGCRVSCCFSGSASELTARQITQGMGEHEGVSSSFGEVSSLPEVASPSTARLVIQQWMPLSNKQVREHAYRQHRDLGPGKALRREASPAHSHRSKASTLASS